MKRNLDNELHSASPNWYAFQGSITITPNYGVYGVPGTEARTLSKLQNEINAKLHQAVKRLHELGEDVSGYLDPNGYTQAITRG